ncbi:PTS sugar transporter subunit IIA [Biomaibacter acetigenes]|jgi:PTS system galactitol-specific IIA component|uniref:PTS sugar transporter subunit IIA n=1 Tax=Biomaibacter acetigenes TaxID=2316383 RepID=A0A3G2R596_9FIRM|nr:PTS sugar transporter subunit IIA [Biomaibacter acetigenes]AYO30067.1 PTS sugar transporter subunit IIA [Biomaibacter acetigenes]
MMPELNFLNPELIQIDAEADDKEGIIKKLANLLISKGYAKESYLEAILEREKVFPTGLPTEGVGVAIPHADIKHVIKPAIAVAILKHPVQFNVMGNPEEKVSVKIIFMLAITDPNIQLKLLQDLMEIFQNKQLLLKLAVSRDVDTVLKLMTLKENYNTEQIDVAGNY